MGRRTALASLATATVDDVPGKSDPLLLPLPLDALHCTRFNPRRNFGTDEELKEFGQKLEKEQLQPAVVVSRAAYLKLWPDEAENVGTASYVIANGERRYRASVLAGRKALEVIHREDVAKSKAAFLDAVQSENNDRKDLDPIERAIAIDTMVTELGGADQVAAYYEKTKGWVSQQRKLLKLTPEMQKLVSDEVMPVRVARDIAGKPPEEQAAAWKQELAQRAQPKPRPPFKEVTSAPTAAEEPVAERFTAVNQPAPDTTPAPPALAAPAPTAPPGSDRFTAVNQDPPAAAPLNAAPTATPPGEPTGEGVPEPRSESTAEEQQASATGAQGDAAGRPTLDYSNGPWIARHLGAKMDPGPYFACTQLMLRQSWEKGETETLALLAGFMEQAMERSPKEFQKLLEASSERLGQAH